MHGLSMNLNLTPLLIIKHAPLNICYFQGFEEHWDPSSGRERSRPFGGPISGAIELHLKDNGAFGGILFKTVNAKMCQ